MASSCRSNVRARWVFAGFGIVAMRMVSTFCSRPPNEERHGYYNRAGIYTDGTAFTNPATGGIDGSGYAYSGTLLGGAQTWSNTVFNFGPVNATNVISATNQTISLPAGNYYV